MFVLTDDFVNRLRFRRTRVRWVANHHLRLGRNIEFQVRVLLAEVQVEVLWEFPSVPLLSAFPHLDAVSRVGPSIPESISTSKFHYVPRASTVSRRLHCSPGGFSAN